MNNFLFWLVATVLSILSVLPGAFFGGCLAGVVALAFEWLIAMPVLYTIAFWELLEAVFMVRRVVPFYSNQNTALRGGGINVALPFVTLASVITSVCTSLGVVWVGAVLVS
ncbi:hypothetical protein ml_122 [Mollivirus sibericum]|uniref:hypothetical protein n=1 Tax=Mollivirus sibericum TaxID=1678078 RepID=UPI0006B2DD36|nr:hypothetical protein ml_122 [Mollivirus sibericum]ALD61924.1 hypothetical protein ml_122 [Mollivirus sibericum]